MVSSYRARTGRGRSATNAHLPSPRVSRSYAWSFTLDGTPLARQLAVPSLQCPSPEFGHSKPREAGKRGRPTLRGFRSVGSTDFDNLHFENGPLLVLNRAAHISAAGVGVYVGRNNEPSGLRNSPSLECGFLPRLRGHQQQPK
jgi:hypothetical protein